MDSARTTPADRWLWSSLARWWSGWRQAVFFVQPTTVVAWQQRRFRNYWRALSESGRPGRPRISPELRQFIKGAVGPGGRSQRATSTAASSRLRRLLSSMATAWLTRDGCAQRAADLHARAGCRCRAAHPLWLASLLPEGRSVNFSGRTGVAQCALTPPGLLAVTVPRLTGFG